MTNRLDKIKSGDHVREQGVLPITYALMISGDEVSGTIETYYSSTEGTVQPVRSINRH